jgi:hypothetical protein
MKSSGMYLSQGKQIDGNEKESGNNHNQGIMFSIRKIGRSGPGRLPKHLDVPIPSFLLKIERKIAPNLILYPGWDTLSR